MSDTVGFLTLGYCLGAMLVMIVMAVDFEASSAEWLPWETEREHARRQLKQLTLVLAVPAIWPLVGVFMIVRGICKLVWAAFGPERSTA